MFESHNGIVAEAAVVVVIDGDLAGEGQDVGPGIGFGHVIGLAHHKGGRKG